MRWIYYKLRQYIRDGFTWHFSVILFFKSDEMSSRTSFTVKSPLVFVEYIFQFFINKALLASNSVHRQNFMGKNVTCDKFNAKVYRQVSWWICIALPLHAKGLKFNSRRRILCLFSSSFCFVLFRFFKNIFSFFGRLKLQVNYQLLILIIINF